MLFPYFLRESRRSSCLLLLCFCGLTLACNRLQQADEELGAPLARVGDVRLYTAELEGILPNRYTEEDSANIVGRYINGWIKRQLILQSAEQNFAVDEEEIERKIQDYRYQLILYAYEKYFVQENLNPEVSEQEILQYYEENLDNFQLKENIIKGSYLKLAKEAPRINRVKMWLSSNDPEDEERLLAYARTYADVYLLGDTLWYKFDDFIGSTPFREEIINPVNTLKNKRYLETTDENFVYMIYIQDYKTRDQVSPLAFVQDRIREIIINRRALALKKQHEDELFQKGLEEKLYEIY